VDGGQPDAGGTGVDAGNTGAPDAGPHPCRARAQDVPGVQRVVSGNVTTLPAFPSTQLQNQRRVTVRVPPGEGPFPVLYAHDGQNLFDPSTAFGGQEWGLDEAAARLWADGIRFIVVGVDNNANRIPEMTPVPDPQYGGGNGDAYLRFVLDEVKPYVDFHFATRCEPEHTAMMGSSLGGLISFHAGRTRSDVVGRVAALSPSFWWNGGWTATQYAAQQTRNPVILWMDGGTDENGVISNVRIIRNRALALGHTYGTDLATYEAEREGHNERAWRHRLDAVLRFVMGPRRNDPPQHAYAWVMQNPLPVGGVSSAILQVSWEDGRAYTVPGSSVAWGVGSSTGITVDTRGDVTVSTVGTKSVTASWAGFQVATPLDVRANPQDAVELVFRVTVPANTPAGSIHVAANHAALGMWDPAANAMQRIHARQHRFTALVPRNVPTLYKYTRGGWPTVEVDGNGVDVGDRQDDSSVPYLLWDEVPRWHDQ
jgi:predicted alpha/beta superfamily hydrolase